MFDTVLVANRGEIAVRVIRTLRLLGIRSVAVYSDADAAARHVREADVAVRLGPASARESYLSIDRVIEAAVANRAQAIHPGYGFLSENADFARACAKAGVVFIGPPVEAVEVMGDKIRAKRAVSAAGVPVVPGRTDLGMTDDDLVAAADEIGYPVLVKPSAGGGGKGMRLVTAPAVLRAELTGARREAASSFGDDTLFVERFVERPRHIEVQILADSHGTVLHLGERECSLQRRHQKVIEEAPSPAINAATRERLGAAAVDTARSVGYTGAGTVEFIAPGSSPDEFFFMEMNTRLQVEHPVTEMVTGLDLVELQLKVAAGEKLQLSQADITLTGHAVEARVYAEDPARGFLPTGGRALLIREPTGTGVRVDSSLVEGVDVGTTYDPMLAKVIAWGPDRTTALARLDRALAETAVLGVGTNIAFLRTLITNPAVRAGDCDTEMIDRNLEELTATSVPDDVYAGWVMHRLLTLTPDSSTADPWALPHGWRIGSHAETMWRVEGDDGQALLLGVTGSPADARIRIGDAAPVAAHATAITDGLQLSFAGRTVQVTVAEDGPLTWLWLDGHAYAVRELAAPRRGQSAGVTTGAIRSPMPGAVVAVHVETGQPVAKGAALLVVEAMKMEHTLVAPFDGTVDVAVRVGDQVVVDQQLAVVAP